MKIRFPGNTYTTPERNKALRYRITPCSSAMFYFDMMSKAMLPARKLALKGKLGPPEMVNHIARVADAIEDSGAKFEITGMENITEHKEEPMVFIANHMSSLETWIIPCIVFPHKPMTFVVKESLPNHWVFGPIMRACEPISVTRTNPKQDLKTVFNEGTAALKDGKSVMVFPQTTRMTGFDPTQFTSLGEKLARRAGVRVVPVALRTDFWGCGKWMKDVGKIQPKLPVRIAFGAPLSETDQPKVIREKIIDFITSRLKEWDIPVYSETSTNNEQSN